MDVLIILLLILLNGILSMTEMAFVSSRKYRQHADDRFLSTIQIGITLIAILTGLFSATLTMNLHYLAVNSRNVRVSSRRLNCNICNLSPGHWGLVPKRINYGGR